MDEIKKILKDRDDLDKIAEGDLTWYNLLDRFYNDFEPKVTSDDEADLYRNIFTLAKVI